MKYKYFLFGILSTIIIIFILSLISFNNVKNKTIYIKDIPAYGSIISKNKTNLDKIKNEDCKSSINNMINRINETHYSNNISISEYVNSYYKDNKDFTNFYYDTLEKCNIEENDELKDLLLVATLFPSQLKEVYNTSYEIRLIDNKTRDEFKKNNNEMGSFITKYYELKILNRIVDELNGKKSL